MVSKSGFNTPSTQEKNTSNKEDSKASKKNSKEQNSFVKINRDLAIELLKDSNTSAIYLCMKVKSAWGDFIVRKRGKPYSLKAGQCLTSVNELLKLIGCHRCTVQNSLKILSEMGIIKIDPMKSVGMLITMSENCTTSLKDATRNIKERGDWQTSRDYVSKKDAKSLSANSEDRVDSDSVDKIKWVECAEDNSEDRVDSDSEDRVDSDAEAPFPSLVLKEELIIDNIIKRRAESVPSSAPPNFMSEKDFYLNQLDVGGANGDIVENPFEALSSMGYSEDQIGLMSEEEMEEHMAKYRQFKYIKNNHMDQTYSETDIKDPHEDEDKLAGATWYACIKSVFPTSKVKLEDLVEISNMCREFFTQVDFDAKHFPALLNWAADFSSPYERNMMFKNPKKILKMDEMNTCFLQEIMATFKLKSKDWQKKIDKMGALDRL